MSDLIFPKRIIHLDFHTGPQIPDVGRDFDADSFADVFANANVDSVTVFAKCHHGHLYYSTERAERHPALPKDLDLLGAQIEALHRRGIRAPIYMSVQCDEYAANTHPEWIALDTEGKQVKWGGPFSAGWRIMDMSSPYQDYLAEELAEVLRLFAPVDGVFMDMCWDQISVTKWAQDGMRKRGYDPTDANDRSKYAREVVLDYMARFKVMVDEAQKGRSPAGVWFNSRPKTALAEEKKFLRHVEIESLPTGGWGYAYFPYVARYVRPFGLPTLSHTGRFHESWGDFSSLKPEAALKYECSLILSQGMTSGIGDQLHPRGTLDKPAYEMIGRVYGHIKACEEYVEGGEIQSEMAVIVDPNMGDNPGAVGLGIIRSLQQLRFQFDLLPASADISAYPLVIMPECIKTNEAIAARLQDYVLQGGALILCGDVAFREDGSPLLPEQGIAAEGKSPYSVVYMHPEHDIASEFAQMDHVLHSSSYRIKPVEGALSLCGVAEPYFERTYDHFCSHCQTPEDSLTDYSLAVQNGKVITIAASLFTAYGKHGNLPYRQLIGACIRRLLPEPLIRDEGPAHLETSVVRSKHRTVAHLISYCPVRRTEGLDIVEDAFPLVDMPLSVKLSSAPKRVFLAPSGLEIPFQYRDGRADVKVSCLDGHVMVVFED